MNELAVGSLARLLMREEATWGVHPLGAGTVIPIMSEGLAKDISTFASRTIRSDRKSAGVRGGNIRAGGQISTELRFSAIGTLMKRLLLPEAYTTGADITPATLADDTAYARGAYVTHSGKHYLCVAGGHSAATAAALTHETGVQSSGAPGSGKTAALFEYFGNAVPKLHTFAGGRFPYNTGLTVEKAIEAGANDMYISYVGGVVDSLQLSVPQEGPVECNWSLLFVDADDTVLGTRKFTSEVETVEDYVVGYDVSASIHNSSSLFATTVSALNLSIANQYEPDIFVLNQRNRRALPPGTRTISGSFTCYFNGPDEYQLFRDEAERGVTFGFNVNGRYMDIAIPTLKFTGGQPVPMITGGGTLSSTFEFQAYQGLAEAYDIRARLYTSDAAY